jgi:hypothetical protein
MLLEEKNMDVYEALSRVPSFLDFLLSNYQGRISVGTYEFHLLPTQEYGAVNLYLDGNNIGRFTETGLSEWGLVEFTGRLPEISGELSLSANKYGDRLDEFTEIPFEMKV